MSRLRVVLASNSPRRRALLEALGLHVEVVPSGVDELLTGEPEALVIENADRKCSDVAGRLADPALVIAADTLVFIGDEVLAKPETLDEACSMIARLSGQTHRVITGLAVRNTATGAAATASETTEVTFRSLSRAEIERFVEAVRPLDRAGAYTVDGPGSLLVAGYRGCYQNVLGLPIVRLDQTLRPMGHSLFDFVDADRAIFL